MEGVSVVRFGTPQPGEFLFMGGGHVIGLCGPSENLPPAFVVVPEPGWKFVNLGSAYADAHIPVREFPEKEIVVRFRVSNTREEQRITDAVKYLSDLVVIA